MKMSDQTRTMMKKIMIGMAMAVATVMAVGGMYYMANMMM
jgi:hypothetical protein